MGHSLGNYQEICRVWIHWDRLKVPILVAWFHIPCLVFLSREINHFRLVYTLFSLAFVSEIPWLLL